MSIPNGSQATTGEHMNSCAPPLKKYHPTPLLTHCQTSRSGDRRFFTASRLYNVTCAQSEPAFICEEHRTPVAKLPILVFCQFWQPAQYWAVCITPTCGHQALILPSCSLFLLSRHTHICGAPKFILQGSGSALPVPPCTKVKIGRCCCCCWVVAFLRPSPCLLMYWPVSWQHLHALETLTDTANFLATACIVVPFWISCTP